MKKTILFLLVSALLLLPLSSCFADKQNEGTTPNNTTENTTPEVTTPEATTPPENNQDNTPVVNAGELLDKESDLVVTLVDYLKEYWIQVERVPLSLANQINEIKNGAKPLHVVFDSANYYYVCGYYTSPHELEYMHYCCPEEYTWVKYEDESQIQEYSNEMKCIVAFQINNALTVTDILSNETNAPDMQHFQIYAPTFENGVNAREALVFDETFIYLNDTNKDTLYHCVDVYYHELITIPCVCLDNQYYISVYLDTIGSGEIFNLEKTLSKDSITYNFGEYYDSIVSIMNTEKHRVTNEQGYTHCYGLILIADFISGIIE